MKDTEKRIYCIWQKMKQRCYNPKQHGYERYGGRGITVCDEWKNNFTAFKEWALSHGYDNSLSIDRIDFDGNYEPTNCRWADTKTQANNTSRNHYITYKGETKTLAQWADCLGINRYTLHVRIDIRGWSIERAFETTPKTPKRYANDEERQEAYRQQSRNRYWKNKTVILERNKERYKKNREKVLARCKEYRIKNSDKCKQKCKRYRENNRDKLALAEKAYRAAHAEHIKETKDAWYQLHKKEVRSRMKSLCNDPRNPGSTCTLQALINFAGRYKDNPLVNNMSPTKWAKQFII